MKKWAMDKFECDYIGVVHSPHLELANMPIQPVGAREIEGTIEVYERFAAGLKDLDGFSHIYILYHFHKANRSELEVVPYMDTHKRGVFATRSPLRPSHIGLSIVELLSIEANCLRIKGVDMLDGTPVLDIKPYIEKFDHRKNATSGWMNGTDEQVRQKRSDDRFV